MLFVSFIIWRERWLVRLLCACMHMFLASMNMMCNVPIPFDARTWPVILAFSATFVLLRICRCYTYEKNMKSNLSFEFLCIF